MCKTGQKCRATQTSLQTKSALLLIEIKKCYF